MGIKAEKQLVSEGIKASKPTDEEIKLAAQMDETVVPIAWRPAFAEALAAHRIRVTQRVLLGEGYDTPHDLEKRQILSRELGAVSARNGELIHENARLVRSLGLRAVEVDQLKESNAHFEEQIAALNKTVDALRAEPMAALQQKLITAANRQTEGEFVWDKVKPGSMAGSLRGVYRSDICLYEVFAYANGPHSDITWDIHFFVQTKNTTNKLLPQKFNGTAAEMHLFVLQCIRDHRQSTVVETTIETARG